jgi:hypothetical protein
VSIGKTSTLLRHIDIVWWFEVAMMRELLGCNDEELLN